MTNPITLSPTEAAARVVRRAGMVPERVAFIDCKMPGSHLKENYSLIGPGVTQSKDQKVALSEPHGFSLGVAAMPAGITNNLHIHYTAEVFMIYKGRWLFRWGANGDEGEIIGEAGDVVSIPTWIFRGFTNVGDSEGWIFTALGADETGGIIWHPNILKVAAEHGLYLTRDNMMVDTANGEPMPEPGQLMEPMTQEQIQSLRKYTVEEMTRQVVFAKERDFSGKALLDSAIPGHGGQLAPILGNGLSEDRDHAPKIMNPHGMSLEWGKIPEGGQIGPFSIAEKQALIVFKGSVDVCQDPARPDAVQTVGEQDLYSFPANSWRTLRATPGHSAEFVLMTAGDHKKRIAWSDEIVAQAASIGLAIDHNGYVADLDLLPYETRKKLRA
jgi:quercetin dioxygenase-like cupin family protein